MPIRFPEDACALRPVRWVGADEIRLYDAVEFLSENPAASCDTYYRRCVVFGGVAQSREDEAGTCDVLNASGDIVDDFPLTKKGLNWLYKALGTRVAT